MPWFRRPMYKWVLNTRLLRQHMYPVSQMVPDVVEQIVSTYNMDPVQFENSFSGESQNELKYLSAATRIGVKNRSVKREKFVNDEAIIKFLRELWRDLKQ